MSIFPQGAELDPGLQRTSIDNEFARVWAALGGQAASLYPAKWLKQLAVSAATTFAIPQGYVIGQNTQWVPYNNTPGIMTLNWGITHGGGEVAVTKANPPLQPYLTWVAPAVAAPDNSGNAFTLYIDGTWGGATADFFIHIIPWAT